MTFWLTVQFPPVSHNNPGVWVRPWKEIAAQDLAKNDLVFVYETNYDRENRIGGGASAVVSLIEITERVHQTGEKWVKVANGVEKAQGNCPHDKLLNIIGYGRIQSMGPKNAKLMPINEQIFEQISAYFPDYRSDYSKSAEEAVETFENTRQGRGQAFALKEVRDIIEKYSMEKAKGYFKGLGYKVDDHHKNRPYDLKCSGNGEEYFVEVKGTQSNGNQILLTPREVDWVNAHKKSMKLFILHSIDLSGKTPQLIASAGEILVIEPWKLNKNNLNPIGYTYDL